MKYDPLRYTIIPQEIVKDEGNSMFVYFKNKRNFKEALKIQEKYSQSRLFLQNNPVSKISTQITEKLA